MSRLARAKPDVRRKLILDAALELAGIVGYKSITRDDVADVAGITSSLIAHYYPRMGDIKTAVMQEAIEREVIPVIAQGLALSDPLALAIKRPLRAKVIKYLFNL